MMLRRFRNSVGANTALLKQTGGRGGGIRLLAAQAKRKEQDQNESPAQEPKNTPKIPACDFKPKPYNGMSHEQMTAVRKRLINPGLFLYYKKPLVLASGHMQYVFDEKGRRYLDFLAGILTTSVGHCHPKINEAMREQMDLVMHSTNIYLHPNIHVYAEKLAAKLPKQLNTMYFVNSGSEANDLAMFMAREYTKRSEIITFQHSYHGMSPTTMALTNLSTWRYDQPTASGVQRAVCPDPYKGPWGGDKCRDSPCQPNNRTCQCKVTSDGSGCKAAEMYLQQFETMLDTCTPKGGVAGFFAEPIMGVGGFIQTPRNFMKHAYEMVRARGGVCVSDEVQTGFGRLGSHYWGFETLNVVPDIVTMAKGIANGFPMAAVVTTSEIAQTLSKALHFNTFGGSPMACAVASATLDAMDEDQCQQRSAELGTYLLKRLAEMRDKYSDVVGDVRGKGLMLGVEMIEPGTQKLQQDASEAYYVPPKPLAADKVANIMEMTKEMGVLFGKGGLRGNVLRVAPPMCITKEDADFAVDVLDMAIKKACF